MHETSARGWCTGKTQRDGVGREVGGGSGWGIHVNPWLIHVNVRQKPLQYCKVISLQPIKINEKKKEAKVLFADVMIACTENQRISKNELLEIIRKFNKVAKSTSI